MLGFQNRYPGQCLCSEEKSWKGVKHLWTFINKLFATLKFSFNNIILQAFCEEGNIAENGVLSFAKFVIFPILELNAGEGKNMLTHWPRYTVVYYHYFKFF